MGGEELQVDQERIVASLPNYEVGGVLGRGSWGIVYAGRHRSLGRDVAIKELPPAFASDAAVRARFMAEGRLLATLDHPHVVPVYDFIERDGLCLLVMELLPGGTVADLHNRRRLSPQVACALVLAAAAGLHHAHTRGLLHRDVKPENLMFSSSGTLKVTDFGIAKMLGGSATVATRAGEVLGTPAYMAPEQVQGVKLTPATDVYALASVLYYLLSGELPFSREGDLGAVLYRRVYQDPIPLPDVAPDAPPAVVELTMQALAKEPEDRPASTEDFGVGLAEAAINTWGVGWLGDADVTLASAGPIIAAALGENRYRSTVIADAPGAQPAATEPPVATETPVAEVVGPAELVPLDRLAPPPPEAVGAAAPSVDRAEPAAASRSPRRLRPPAPVIWGLAVLAVGAGAFIAGRSGGDDSPSERATGTAGVTPPAAPQRGSWQSLAQPPSARQQVAATVVGGTIWVVGGLVGTEAASVRATASTEAFDPAISAWRTGPDLPVALHHPSAVTYRGELVVLGGFAPGGNLTARSSDRVFALRDGSWAELPRMKHPRAAGAATVVGDRIVVAGGQAGGRMVEETEVFDGERWRDVSPMPTPREHLAAASDGRYAYFVGGRELSSDRNKNVLERYDPKADEWTRLPGRPTASGGLGAAVVGRRLVTVGGEDPVRALRVVEAYDLDARSWTTLAPLRTGRHGMGVVGLGRSVFAVGGATQASHANSSRAFEALTLPAAS